MVKGKKYYPPFLTLDAEKTKWSLPKPELLGYPNNIPESDHKNRCNTRRADYVHKVNRQ